MANPITQEQKMKQWAQNFKGGKFSHFAENPDMLKIFYIKYNMPTKVSEIVVDSEAKLTIMISNTYKRQPLKLCGKCWRSVCNADKCGYEDYGEYTPRSYKGADLTGAILVDIAPFKPKLQDLEEDEWYTVEGRIKDYKGKISINVESVEGPLETPPTAKPPKEVTEEPPAKKKAEPDVSKSDPELEAQIKDMLELFDGEIPAKKLNQITKDMDYHVFVATMQKMDLKQTDDVYKVRGTE